MSKKRSRKLPTLHPTQLQSADSLTPDEAAERRAQVEAARAAGQEQKGRELLITGTRLLQAGQPDEAASFLEEAVRLLPDNPDAAINLGGTYIMLRRYNRAVTVLEAASQRHSQHAMVWVNLAAAYLGTLEISGPQQQARAIDAFNRALDVDPATPHVHYNLGLIYKDQGDLPMARHHFQQARQVDPHDRDARHWLDTLDRLEQETDDSAG